MKTIQKLIALILIGATMAGITSCGTVKEDTTTVGAGTTVSYAVSSIGATSSEIKTTVTELPYTTQTPMTTTAVPVTTTEAPVTTTEAPVTTTEAPVTTTEAPATTTEAPVTTTKVPVTTKAPVTTQAPVTETKPVKEGIETLLNSQKLNPMKTNSPSVDALVDEIFTQILTDKMSTYEKVKACFDYLVENCTYGSSFWFGYNDDVIYTSYYDQLIVINSYSILSTNVGVCDHYSAAFVVMCRRIGLDAYEVGGTISKKGGGRSGHAWAYINLNGTHYIFDPQVQSNNMQAPYFFFGKTYEEMGTRYELEEGDDLIYDESTFANFECYETPAYDISVTLTLSADDRSNKYTCAQQNGLSTWMVVHDENNAMTTDSEGNILLTVNPSGGSGKYYCLIYASDDENPDGWLIVEEEIEGERKYSLDYSTFPTDLNPMFYVMVVDARNDYSYVSLENIRFALPEGYEAPASDE